MGKYKVYHIPGIKVGCTMDIQKRVVETQGYKPGEYEILLQTDSITEASKAERMLQQDLGYTVDRQPYKDLFKKHKNMSKHTSSPATTTFKISKKDIDATFLMDLVIKTPLGTYVLDTEDKIDWVISNCHNSQFGPRTCYIYNKALSEAAPFATFKEVSDIVKNMEVFDRIRDWAYQRGLYDKGNPTTQLDKLVEEVGELSKATLNNDKEEIIDAIGDCVVVLTNLAHLNSLRIEDCIESAYAEIANRTGEMKNGTFVKNN